jgi:formate dehydrogenase subunit beta
LYYENGKEGKKIMSTSWMLKTKGDPLVAVRTFLQALWSQADLDGILIQLEPTGGKRTGPQLVDDPALLETADPFLPLVTVNSAKLVIQLSRQHPEAYLAAILRPCEVRALSNVIGHIPVDLKHWFIIGVDCLASFPAEDFEWRLQKAGTAEELTRQILRNARQGGISPDRFRSACQMCASPASQEVDLCMGLLGLPVKEYILVTAKDEDTARRLHLHEITSGLALSSQVTQREEMLDTLFGRRTHLHERMVLELPSDLPSSVSELAAFIEACAPCQICLEVCPIYSSLVAAGAAGGELSMDDVTHWLTSCVACGMCEQACPKHTPLPAIISRIDQELREELMTA